MKRTYQILGLLTCSLAFIFSACVQQNGTQPSEIAAGTNMKTVIVNHRGANRLAPENTYAAARKAIESGASYIEVDVRRSKDGVYYVLHDKTLDRTTNGTGLIAETESDVVDTLDAGSWFGLAYAGERVPRLREYLQWIKGKANVYFDVKDADLKELVAMVDSLGLKNNCFFWFSDWQRAKAFRKLYPDHALKINASSTAALDSVKTVYNPQIIECSVDNLSDEFIRACHSRGFKIMPWISGNDMEAYRIALEKKVDMINLDNPDIFSNMMKNNGTFKGYKLIAHRGGVTEGKYNEYDPKSIQEAIDRGYYMLEIDVRQTKDGVLILNHDPGFGKFFNTTKRVNEMTWDEIKQLRSDKGDFRPMSLEELARMCSGKIQFMLDLKEGPSDEYYRKLEQILEKYQMLSGAYFIDYDARTYFRGKAKFNFRVSEAMQMKEKLDRGEDVACHYFLFDNANRLNSEVVKWCQQNSITVVPSVNTFHYQFENDRRGAQRDIEFLKECGVTEFQIDSQYDRWLPTR
jgi:glycerophosphoryl diester phosphodiesterase